MKTKLLAAALLLATLGLSGTAMAEQYAIDIKGQHAFIEFRIRHLGFGWVIGQFRSFSGNFVIDDKHPQRDSAKVSIDVASIDTNHAERDKHLRDADFLDAEHYPTATFVSTSYKPTGKDTGILNGVLTLHGVKKDVALNVHQLGIGPDPWGGYRRGFEASTTLHLSDYRLKKGGMLGPLAENVELFITLDGLRTGLFDK
jgi:polyisoprenoid-binding protein YceI